MQGLFARAGRVAYILVVVDLMAARSGPKNRAQQQFVTPLVNICWPSLPPHGASERVMQFLGDCLVGVASPRPAAGAKHQGKHKLNMWLGKGLHNDCMM